MGMAELKIGDKTIDLPMFEGSESEKAIDIRALRKETGFITYDPGFVNTGCCKSDITYIDGEKGILRYRGYDINDIAEKCEFVDVAYLLVHGTLPNKAQHGEFSAHLNNHSMLHEDMRHFFGNFPDHAHPMATLSAMAVSLSSFYPELEDTSKQENIDYKVTRLLSKMRTIAAFTYKKSIGHPVVQPRHDLKYCENFLNMMFSTPVNDYQVDPIVAKALNKLSPDTASRVLGETLPQGTKPLQALTTGETVRAIHGASYTRLYNADLLTMVRDGLRATAGGR